ncbi:MAG: FISUMP domain-containing protein [Gammaproteobacteria bacterium]
MKSLMFVALIVFTGLIQANAADCNANGQDDTFEFDSDGDGVINACDNCLLVPNDNQLDSNGDGYGNVCDADLDNNGAVNFIDISLFSNAFLSSDPDADLNGDGAVNFLDLSIVTPFFLEAPGPGLPEAAVTPDENMVDVEGNVYRTIRFENQIWMAENLKTTTFNDGESILEHEPGSDWNDNNVSFITTKFQWPSIIDFNNVFDFDLPFDFFGAVYNSASLNTGRLCPTGWRLPTAQDWLTLEAFVANDGFAGVEADALRSDFGWLPAPGSDEYGFRLLSSGYVTVFGTPTGSPAAAILATSSVDLPSNSRVAVTFLGSEGSLQIDDLGLTFGMAVRCIKN